MANGTLRERVAEAASDAHLFAGEHGNAGDAVQRLADVAMEAVNDAEQVQALTLPEVGKGSPSFALGEARGLIREALGIIAELREQYEMFPPRGAEGYAESRCDDAIAKLTKALEVTK